MSEEVNKLKDFSIWESVVNDKIIQYEELEKKYNARTRQLEEVNDDKGIVMEQNKALLSKMNKLGAELSKKQNEISQLKAENSNLKKYIENMENSTSWRVTKPIRKVMDKVKW